MRLALFSLLLVSLCVAPRVFGEEIVDTLIEMKLDKAKGTEVLPWYQLIPAVCVALFPFFLWVHILYKAETKNTRQRRGKAE